MNATVAEMLAGLAIMLDAVHIDDELQDVIEDSLEGLREYCNQLYLERIAGIPEGPTPRGWYPPTVTPGNVDGY